ncbi:MAG: 2-oxoacid:acceptor oxidoreductase subunit alpha, partial [Candidatus Methylomirabilales bacterium]
FELSLQAYNLADIYQTPVVILSDMFLSESHKSVKKSFIENLISDYRIDRGKTIYQSQISNLKSQNYLRYKITEDGISPRIIPGSSGYFYQANSYEHLEDGHTTEEAKPRRLQVEKRNRKIASYLKNHFQPPKVYGDFEKAELIFVSWGSNKGAILEAQKLLAEKGTQTAFIHFSYLYP